MSNESERALKLIKTVEVLDTFVDYFHRNEVNIPKSSQIRDLSYVHLVSYISHCATTQMKLWDHKLVGDILLRTINKNIPDILNEVSTIIKSEIEKDAVETLRDLSHEMSKVSKYVVSKENTVTEDNK